MNYLSVCLLNVVISLTVTATAFEKIALDPTFGKNGIVDIPLAQSETEGAWYSQSIVDVEGRTINVADYDRYNNIERSMISIYRLKRDGSFDPTFGKNGHVVIDWGLGYSASPKAVKLDSSGRLYIASVIFNPSLGFKGNPGVIRLLPDGRIDNSFGSFGKTLLPSEMFYDGKLAIAIDSKGRAVLAAAEFGSWKYFVQRLTPIGTVDTLFGKLGKFVFQKKNMERWAVSLAITQEDGVILAGGDSFDADQPYSLLLKLTAKGELEGAFGSSGVVYLSLTGTDDTLSDVTIDSMSRIVVVGRGGKSGEFDFVAARYLKNGALDKTFNQTGIWRDNDTKSDDWGTTIFIDQNERIVLGGNSTSIPGSKHSDKIMRLKDNGTIETAFAEEGSFRYSSPDFLVMHSFFVGPDEKYLLGGPSDTGNPHLIRLIP